ncbi:MAG TPA: response regulator, partial [Lysobacter sp.]
RGSTFELRLPLPAQEAPTSSVGQHDAVGPLSMRVLLVDDNADVGGSLAETLRLFDAEVHLLHDGAAALDAFDGIAPDVAILDIGMPVVTGYDVARGLRARGVGIPLIALTGWGQVDDRQRALAAGFDHHLVKPVAVPELVALLASLRGVSRDDGVRVD